MVQKEPKPVAHLVQHCSVAHSAECLELEQHSNCHRLAASCFLQSLLEKSYCYLACCPLASRCFLDSHRFLASEPVDLKPLEALEV